MATRSPHKRKKTAKEFKESAGPVGGMIRPGPALSNSVKRGLQRITTTFKDTPKIHVLKASLLRRDPKKSNLPEILKRAKKVLKELTEAAEKPIKRKPK